MNRTKARTLLLKSGLLKDGKVKKNDVKTALTILAESEAVDTPFDEILQGIRDAIHELRTRLWKQDKSLKLEHPEADTVDYFAKVEAVMSKLHKIDDEIAKLL